MNAAVSFGMSRYGSIAPAPDPCRRAPCLQGLPPGRTEAPRANHVIFDALKRKQVRA